MRDINILKNFNVDIDKSLEILGDMETYDEILGDFLEEMENKMLKSKVYMESRDYASYAILVHALKSASRYLGFDELGEMFYKHEMESKSNNYAFVDNHFNELMNFSSTSRDVISRYLASGNSSELVKQTIEHSKINVDERTLLVADDSELIRNIIKRIFENETDFKIMFANDGEEVIEIIECDTNSNIIGLLLDLNMPNKDGFAVLDYLKERRLFSSVPVSIISGNDNKENIDRAFQYQIIDMLRKPFSESEVRGIVGKTIK